MISAAVSFCYWSPGTPLPKGSPLDLGGLTRWPSGQRRRVTNIPILEGVFVGGHVGKMFKLTERVDLLRGPSLSASFSLLTPMLPFRYCSMISSVFEPCYPIAREACAQDRVEIVLYAYSDPTMYQRISTEVIN